MSRLLARFVARHDDPRVAIRDAVGTHSYAAVVSRALRIAAGLRRSGPLRGRRVALLVAPGADFVSAFFGALLAEASVVVLSPLHPAPETAYFCADAAVRLVIVDDVHAEAVSGFPTDRVASLVARDGDRSSLAAAADIDESAPALQLYTSGTTGKPKGAILTHGNLGVQQELLASAWGFDESDVLLHALPLHHMHGLCIALLTALGAGATVDMTTFDANAIWERMRDASAFMAVPAMYHRLLSAFDAADEATRTRFRAHARALRLATSGSAALPVTLAERWRDLTGTIPLERFGMTEVGVALSNDLHGERFPGSVGLPLPTVEARIVDERGEDAEAGELWIRGPSVFAGYHGKPEETALAFADAAEAADAAGGARWFRTGDTVTREHAHASRPFRILGRTSVDILKSGGYKISALEIEEVLRQHAGIADVAVVGIPDEAWGERVVACLVLRDAAEPIDPEALRAHTRAWLAPYKIPKSFVFMTDFPRNALGKVKKADLRGWLLEKEAP